jgi:pyruvate formate lyase activating enzyme
VTTAHPRSNLPLRDRIDQLTVTSELCESVAETNTIVCGACAHRCNLRPGARGICGVRFNADGKLKVPFGYVAAKRIRPVETNTIYHVRPGSRALTFGMLGCDLRCPYCHNWRLSQAVRDRLDAPNIEVVTPSSLIDEAVRAGCQVVCSAYNEPMITAEWAYAIFAEARRRQMVTALISDANTTAEALAFLRPVTDVFRADLKGYDDAQFQALGGRPEAPLAAIEEAKRLGYWVEVVTLLVPGFNDDPQGLRALAKRLEAIDPEMPWHLNGFVPRYRMADRPAAGLDLLMNAAGIGYGRGLRHVYVGNVADRLTELSHTRCPSCLHVLVRRCNYATVEMSITGSNCSSCGRVVPGLWDVPPSSDSNDRARGQLEPLI